MQPPFARMLASIPLRRRAPSSSSIYPIVAARVHLATIPCHFIGPILSDLLRCGDHCTCSLFLLLSRSSACDVDEELLNLLVKGRIACRRIVPERSRNFYRGFPKAYSRARYHSVTRGFFKLISPCESFLIEGTPFRIVSHRFE